MGLTLAFLRLARAADTPGLLLLCLGVFVVLGLGSIGTVLDGHPKAVLFESLRLTGGVGVMLLAINLVGGLPAFPGLIVAGLFAGSLIWLFALRRGIAPARPALA